LTPRFNALLEGRATLHKSNFGAAGFRFGSRGDRRFLRLNVD
jgi:hypothetical protein